LLASDFIHERGKMHGLIGPTAVAAAVAVAGSTAQTYTQITTRPVPPRDYPAVHEHY
jgi:hypothetical protein